MLFRQKYRDALLTWEKEGVRKETIIYRYIFQKFYDIIAVSYTHLKRAASDEPGDNESAF